MSLNVTHRYYFRIFLNVGKSYQAIWRNIQEGLILQQYVYCCENVKKVFWRRSRWPCGLRPRSEATELSGSRGLECRWGHRCSSDVFVVRCVGSGSSDELITLSEGSCRVCVVLCCVCVCVCVCIFCMNYKTQQWGGQALAGPLRNSRKFFVVLWQVISFIVNCMCPKYFGTVRYLCVREFWSHRHW
jgi:hypothetical protein